MREQATGDRDSQAKIVWQRHLKEKPERQRDCQQLSHDYTAVTLEQAKALTRAAELSLQQ